MLHCSVPTALLLNPQNMTFNGRSKNAVTPMEVRASTTGMRVVQNQVEQVGQNLAGIQTPAGMPLVDKLQSLHHVTMLGAVGLNRVRRAIAVAVASRSRSGDHVDI